MYFYGFFQTDVLINFFIPLRWAGAIAWKISSRQSGIPAVQKKEMLTCSMPTSAEINDSKNQGQEIKLENDEVSFEEVENWENKYLDAAAIHDIPIWPDTTFRWTKSTAS